MTLNPYSCEHKHTEPRRHTKKNGARCVYLQCLDCGYKVKDLKARDFEFSSLKEFDFDLVKKGAAAASAAYWATHQPSQDWWKEYGKYLRSIPWMALRQKAIERDKYRCQRCGAPVTLANAHAHHLSYEGYNKTGHSSLDEVTTLCRDCHHEVHQPGEEP